MGMDIFLKIGKLDGTESLPKSGSYSILILPLSIFSIPEKLSARTDHARDILWTAT